MLVCALVVFAGMSRRTAGRPWFTNGLATKQQEALAWASVWVGLGAIAGAHAWHVLASTHASRPYDVLAFWKGGYCSIGGVLAGFFLVLAVARSTNTRCLDVCVAYTPGALLAVAVVRVGCFLNGCCVGTPSGDWPGVVYPDDIDIPEHLVGRSLHPVQMYASVIALFLALFMLRTRLSGSVRLAVVVVSYLVGRLVLGTVRS
jgi:phosphatidylglycerol:prolipoprotein diacylglycerol transferase